jgi:hypothetical protein
MTLEDLRRAWGRGGGAGAPESDPAGELRAVRARARELEDVVRRRDRRETLVALALLPIFTYFAFQAAGGVTRLGAVILAVSCLAIPLRLRAARRVAVDPSLPVAEFLRLELDLVLRQRRLLLTVPLWYLGPLGVGVILFFAGASRSPWLTALYAAVVIAFFLWLWRLNRTAVVQDLEPREKDLRLWIQLTTDDGDAADKDKERGE